MPKTGAVIPPILKPQPDQRTTCMEFIQPYLDYFSAHPDWAIALIFLIALGEALLIIGLFVPSTAVLVGAGILVGTGHLGFWPVFLATATGAIAGDQVSFWAGRLFGQRLKTLWPLNHYPQLVARGEDFVRLHGGKSIAIGRFVPGVKAVVPGIVGMFGMNQVYFLAVNLSSGLVWTAAHVFPGILIGQGLAFAGELSGRLVVVLLVLLVVLAVAGYIIRLAAAGLSPFLNHGLGRISAWARTYRSRPMQRFARTIAPENPRSLLVVLFAAVFVTGLIGMASMTLRFASADVVSNMDQSIFNLMKEMRNAPADEIMVTLTMLGDWQVMTVLSLTIIAWLLWRKSYRAAMAAAVAIAAGKIFVPVLKYGIQRQRPVALYDGAEWFSFPSGHATMAALIFGILAVLVSHCMGRWGRALVYAICGILVVAIGYSRVYLGAHWLSDVLGGLLFGTVMVAAFGVAIEAIPPRRIRPLGLFGASLIAFIVAGAFHVSTSYQQAELIYAPPQTQVSVSQAEWEQKDWQRLPHRRIDLAGRPGEVFIAQFAGSLESLGALLATIGWTETPKWTWRASLPYLNPHAPLADLPPRPALHEGLKAKLTLISPDDQAGQRRVLRIYKSGLAASSGMTEKPVYLLSLTRESLRRGFNLYAVPSPVPATTADLDGIRGQLEKSQLLRVVASHELDGQTQDLVVQTP